MARFKNTSAQVSAGGIVLTKLCFYRRWQEAVQTIRHRLPLPE
jgi:hypothetical protein